jgi:uncharacterized protein
MLKPLNWIMIGLVKIYQYIISPLMPANCRYQPTCSAYAIEALKLHGPIKGGLLTLKRLGRCHPFAGFGFDPVPARAKETHSSCCLPASGPLNKSNNQG